MTMASHSRHGALLVAAALLVVETSVYPLTAEPSPESSRLENVALRARITATSEYSADYEARFVADRVVPGPQSRDDTKRAWCVQGNTHRDGADLVFEWNDPVVVGEVVYYGRTAWFLEECWRGWEVFADDGPRPVARGQFTAQHGPQRMRLAKPVSARRLVLHFTSSWGGPNPGASEVQIFSESPSDADLAELQEWTATQRALSRMPWVDAVDPEALAELIDRLEDIHGGAYSKSREHRARLAALRRAISPARTAPDTKHLSADEDARAGLARLQREVLLFDVDRLVVIRRHEIEASHVYTYHYEGFRAGGGLYVVDPHDARRDPVELVLSPEGQILDCDVSYDGKTVLFSWRRRESEGYHVWSVGVDGSRLQQLTEGRWHDYNACWLPDGGIAFLSTRLPQFAYCWHAPVGVLHRMRADGSGVRRLSANYLNDFTPYPLHDGRILYTRWEYVDRPAIPIQSLWTINPDGTGHTVYFGNRVISPGTFMEARQIPTTNKIICTMTGHNGPTRGAIGVIDPSKGVNSQVSIDNVTPDVPVPRVGEGNGNTGGTKQYSGPRPLDAVRFLVSARGPVLVRTLSGKCQSLALEAPEDGTQLFCAQPIRARARPPVVPRASPAEPDPGEKYAYVFIQDVYSGLAPQVERGEVHRIRVVRELEKAVRIDPSLRAFGFQFPVISCGATYAGKLVLGEVPVEPDGSAYFRVPAEAPIYFMALDGHGRALQRMRSFTHLMPGEVRGCVGCHEPRTSAPAIRSGMAVDAPPRDLEPPEWGVRGFDYARVVQPVLDRHCVSCHHPLDAPEGVDLTGGKTDFFNVSYDVLARERQGPRGTRHVNWIPTYNGQEQNILEVTPKAWGSPQSRLAELILSGHPDSKGKKRLDMEDFERRRIFAWIDLNVPYYGSSETAYPGRRGCRQLLPADLEEVLRDVARRRCSGCHDDAKIPRRGWTRITEPHLNNFLLAPLAKDAGGTEACGRPVFAGRSDPDYRAILETFRPVLDELRERPRLDMPGGKPAAELNRDCQ